MTAVQLLDPSRLALATPDAGMAVGLVCVYRRRHLDVVHELLDGRAPGWTVRLWSLDGPPPPALEPWTTGSGPGTRFALVNRLIESIPAERRRDGLVVADDDVRFTIGDAGRLVEAGRRLGFDLYQPGHVAATSDSWTFVRRRALTFARETGFVEQGPLFVLSARAQPVLLPFPEDRGMAWGIEAHWAAAAARHGLRQGIVDAVGVRHVGTLAAQYDRDEQERQLADALRDTGLSDMTDIQRELARVGLRTAWSTRPR